MSIRTAITIIVSALITALVINFIFSNTDILQGQLKLFTFSFSVIGVLVTAMLIASAVPSIYFSLQWLKINKKLKQTHKQGKAQAKEDSSWKRITGLMANGAIEKAVEQVKKLPADKNTYYLTTRAELLLEQGNNEAVVQLLETEFHKDPTPEEGYLIAEAYENMGNDERTRNTLETLAHRYPDEAINAMLMLVEHALEKEDWEKVLKWSENCSRAQSQKNVDISELIIGANYELLKKENGAQNDKKYFAKLQQFIKSHPKFVPGYLLLSDAYLAAGQEMKGVSQLERGFEETLHQIFLRKAVKLYLGKEQPEEAIRLMKQISVKRSSANASFELGKLYFELAMFEDAVSTLTPLTSKFKNPQLIYFYLAKAEMKCQHHEKAYEHLQKVINDDSDNINFSSCACEYCGHQTNGWLDRCPKCDSWDTININLETYDQEEMPSPPLSYS